MTSTTVNSAQALFMNLSAGNVKSDSGMEFSGESFSDVLGKQTGTQEEVITVNKSTKVTKDSTHIQDKVKNTESTETKTVEKMDAEVEEVVSDKLEEVGKEVVKELAEELGVSEEEIVAMMEQLGITFSEVLQPENLAEIILQVSGETDMLALTTDENLYQAYKNICDFAAIKVENISQEFGITKEQIMQVVAEQSVVEIPQTEVVDDADAVKVEISVDADVVVDENPAVDTKKELQTVTETENTKATEGADTVNVIEETTDKQNTNHGTASNQEGGATNDASAYMAKPEQQGMIPRNDLVGTNLFMEQLQQVEMPSVQQSYFSPETQNIMNQITEFMRIQVHTDMTEVQLQLQPETLGTLNVHVTSREGVITAHFAAESENVKAVLESQVIQLKETFAQQGLKVEAVEITLASHGFERNLEQGNERRQTPEDGKRKRKNLNLSEISGMNMEEMEDADKINAQMMEANGNTVDYSA